MVRPWPTTLGARIPKGPRKGVTREAFEASIADGTVEDLIENIPVKVGQCHYLPSGTVHALERRDPGRRGADAERHDVPRLRLQPDRGRHRQAAQAPREGAALDCIDFTVSAVEAEQVRSHTASFFTTVTRLVTCPYFKLEKVRFTEGVKEVRRTTSPSSG